MSSIERATTRNLEKLMPGRSVYACMLNDAGKFIDDCVIYRTGPNAFMVATAAPAAGLPADHGRARLGRARSPPEPMRLRRPGAPTSSA
nr:hypothetical protein [Paracoccus mutanolyticus]